MFSENRLVSHSMSLKEVMAKLIQQHGPTIETLEDELRALKPGMTCSGTHNGKPVKVKREEDGYTNL